MISFINENLHEIHAGPTGWRVFCVRDEKYLVAAGNEHKKGMTQDQAWAANLQAGREFAAGRFVKNRIEGSESMQKRAEKRADKLTQIEAYKAKINIEMMKAAALESIKKHKLDSVAAPPPDVSAAKKELELNRMDALAFFKGLGKHGGT